MKYAIIAAGQGSRLASEGVDVPKPLVTVNGEMLIDRLLRIFMQNDASQIVVICNDIMTDVSRHLVDIQRDGLHGRPIPLNFHIKTTPSSMHSFYELSKYLKDSPFIMTTVDTVFKEDEFADYVDAFKKGVEGGIDALMGVTDFIDDEKPLYVGTDKDMNITGFYDSSSEKPVKYVSGGIYGLTPPTIETLEHSIERGESRMRNFQRDLIAEKKNVKAWAFSKVFDVDHKADISKAESFLK
jgi:NDP-sugar pyrophosphorylase family protein